MNKSSKRKRERAVCTLSQSPNGDFPKYPCILCDIDIVMMYSHARVGQVLLLGLEWPDL